MYLELEQMIAAGMVGCSCPNCGARLTLQPTSALHRWPPSVARNRDDDMGKSTEGAIK
jgi:hypothetical protein